MGAPTFDRRGYQTLLLALLVMMPISFLAAIFLLRDDWRIGLSLCMAVAVSFITLEALTARPDNNPTTFLRWKRAQDHRRPVLLCLGDSLMHGNMSASITPEIPLSVTLRIGLTPATYGKTFTDPLWVVNAGQNNLTSHAVLHERLSHGMGVQPDFICIMIGTNDVLAMSDSSSTLTQQFLTSINHLPEPPSLTTFEATITQLLTFIQEASPMVQVGICTLPPIGENLRSPMNERVRSANEIIARVVEQLPDESNRLSVIPIYERLESILEKAKRGGGFLSAESTFVLTAVWQNIVYHMTPFKSWNLLSKVCGHHVLSDGVHLNERGRDVVVEAIVDWLVAKNITKAIAVKQ